MIHVLERMHRCGALLAILGLGCGDWRADPDGLTERDLVVLSELTLAGRAPLGLGNEYAADPKVAAFGQQLFFDKGLSLGREDNPTTRTAVSCADCHSPREWFSDSRPENNVSQGAGLTTRNSPSLVNAAFYETWGWDGRADTLWGQCSHAYESQRTMRGTPALLLEAVRSRYASRYEEVFVGQPLPQADGGVAVDAFYRNILKAWAAYVSRLTSADAPFDRFVAGDREALSTEQRRGLVLFLGKAGCIQCHRGPMFTDNQYHSVGIGQSGRGVPEVDLGREAGLKELSKLAYRAEGAVPPPPPTADDVGRFRTKALRQVAHTGPYFHGGQLATLKDVVWFYAQGGDQAGSGQVSPFMVPLGLSEAEQTELVAFLESLTGAEVPAQLRCDSSLSIPFPQGSITTPIAAGDPACTFGGTKVTTDAGVTRVCNGALPAPRCEGP